MPMILIAANELRESETPSNDPKEEPCHTAPYLSTPVREPHIQDQEERKDQGTVANRPSGALAENMSEAVGGDAHKIVHSSGWLD